MKGKHTKRLKEYEQKILLKLKEDEKPKATDTNNLQHSGRTPTS